METVLTIDPGIKGLGYALWPDFGETVVGKDCIEPLITDVIIIPRKKKARERDWTMKVDWFVNQLRGAMSAFPEYPELAFIEFPEVYNTAKSDMASKKGDLFILAFMAGCLTESLSDYGCKSELVPPSKWKGQMGKKAVHARIMKRLGVKYREHEADAVGLGLWVQGRF